jgi:hypothetical protein
VKLAGRRCVACGRGGRHRSHACESGPVLCFRWPRAKIKVRVTPTNLSKFGPLLSQIRISYSDLSPYFSLHFNQTLILASLISLTYILYVTSNYQVQYFIFKPCQYYWNGYLLTTIFYG